MKKAPGKKTPGETHAAAGTTGSASTPGAPGATGAAGPTGPTTVATAADTQPSRRGFLSTTAKLALAAAGLAGSGALFAVARGSSPGGRRLVLGRLSLAIDSLVFLPEHNLFVVRTALGLGAFSARCTHLGCTVRQNGDGLVCPCHGAHYDRSGHVLGGPAPRDLPWLAVSLQADGQVVVEPREVESGTVTPLGAEHNL